VVKINTVTAIKTIRDNLRTNLTDPYSTAGGTRGTGVQWIFYNEPISSPKYPIIELKKIDNPTTVLTIGSNYWEEEQIFVNIWFYTKNGFKITVSGTDYLNESLVEYYLGQIKTTLKGEFNTLFDAGVKGYKAINTTKIEYDPATQLYFGAVTIRVRFFQQ